MRISDFGFDGGTEHVTKAPYNWSPGLILGAFCTIFRAGPFWKGLGAKFGQKAAENEPTLKYRFLFLIMTATKLSESN